MPRHYGRVCGSANDLDVDSAQDPYYTSNNQWNLSAIGAPQAWDISTGDADVIIAVIDTGVSPSDPLADFNALGF
jgi:hypothetical protein